MYQNSANSETNTKTEIATVKGEYWTIQMCPFSVEGIVKKYVLFKIEDTKNNQKNNCNSFYRLLFICFKRTD